MGEKGGLAEEKRGSPGVTLIWQAQPLIPCRSAAQPSHLGVAGLR